MFRPAIQRTGVLVGMAVISLLVFYGTRTIQVEYKAPAYELKLRAAQRMQNAMDILKGVRMAEAVFVDDVNDPNETALVGSQYSQITTDEGDLNAKISVLDANVAGMIVDYLVRAEVSSGDTVAVMATGSMPGANLAVYCALEEMGIVPYIITSVGASQWGANREDFTWLDMEQVLLDSGIVHFRSHYASLGGGSDIGRRLSPLGRDLILAAIQRNGVPLLDSRDLDHAIEQRYDLYNALTALENFRAFINIGGGAAALGDAATARILGPGLSEHLDLRSLRSPGMVGYFGRADVPVIHILNIKDIFSEFNYPYAATPTPDLGEGEFYASHRYSPLATAIALVLLLTMLVTVGLNSKRKIRNHLEEHEPESYV